MRGVGWLCVAALGCGGAEQPTVAAASTGGAGGAAAASSSATVGGSGGGGGEGGTGGGVGGGQGGRPECVSHTDCPDEREPCQHAVCVEGLCALEASADGPLPDQAQGDCSGQSCRGGSVVEGSDATDAPAPIGECWAGTCSPGPTQEPLPKGESCSANICNGSGTCVKSLPIVCVTTIATYQCGVTPDTFVTYAGPYGGTCFYGDTMPPGWCPPGTPCSVTSTQSGTSESGTCQ